jgi:hypothetical protein
METTSDELDTFLVVIGGDGALLGSNDDFDSTSSSQVAAELPTTGSYIILASSYIFIDNILEFGGSDDEMEFTLRIEGNSEVEDLADGLDLTAEAIDGDSSFNGELDADVNAVYYVFTGAEGDIVNIAMEADDFNTAIHVFGPSGERVAFARADEETFNSSIEGLELPADGGYLIVATDIFFYNALVEDENIPYTGGEFALEVSFE